MRAVGSVFAVAAVCAVAALAAGPGAEASISGTKHDLRDRLAITDTCLPCHAPHAAINPYDGPAWNHSLSAETFTRNGQAISLGRSSKLCMGCHDGVTAVGSYGPYTGSDPLQGSAAIGTALTDDHPVGVAYPGGDNYADAGDPAVAGMLEAGKVECGSCHDAHGGEGGKFLRGSMTGSQLCRTCHAY